mmetsp:Transcript_42304/g.83063  ORF Transcript_42304/g.83063 Transcript_42304/m.83063 type:complete len:147 (-) Transcript_42304:1307-1747(-)
MLQQWQKKPFYGTAEIQELKEIQVGRNCTRRQRRHAHRPADGRGPWPHTQRGRASFPDAARRGRGRDGHGQGGHATEPLRSHTVRSSSFSHHRGTGTVSTRSKRSSSRSWNARVAERPPSGFPPCVRGTVAALSPTKTTRPPPASR